MSMNINEAKSLLDEFRCFGVAPSEQEKYLLAKSIVEAYEAGCEVTEA